MGQRDNLLTCYAVVLSTEFGCGGIHHLTLHGVNILLKQLRYLDQTEIPLRSSYTGQQ